MSEKEIIEISIEGGKASPNSAINQKISAYKLDVNELFKKINEKTKDYSGIQISVKIIIDKNTKDYDIVISTPPTSILVKKILGIELAKITEEDKSKGKNVLGNLTMEQCLKIAKMKYESLLAKDLKAALKQVLGTINSLNGILVENKRPKEIIKEIDQGKWDALFK
jgi:large subunit ribosomal protein L11